MTKRKDPSELKKRGRPAKEKPEEKEPASAVVVSTPESPDTSEVAIVEQPQEAPVTELVPQDGGREAALSIVGGVTTPQLEQALKVQTEQRKLIQQFIQDNLAVDVDYGRIHVVKNCQAETNQRGSCRRWWQGARPRGQLSPLCAVLLHVPSVERVRVSVGPLQGLGFWLGGPCSSAASSASGVACVLGVS